MIFLFWAVGQAKLDKVTDLLRVHVQQSVNVMELALPQSIDEMELDRLNTAIASHLNGKAGQSWLLDLSSTQYMGSALLGMIVNIRQQIRSAGGKLALCGLSAELREIFHLCSMERLFTITATRAQAIKALKS